MISTDKHNKQEDIDWLNALNINAFRLITPKQRASRNEERMIDKRNTRLYALFRLYYERVQLVGVRDNPIVVIDNQFGIPTYLKNFDLFLTQTWDKDSKTIGRCKLTEDFCLGYDNAHDEFKRVLDSVEMFPIHTIVDSKGYYFSGYSKDPEAIVEPVYSRTKPRIYIGVKKAVETLEQLRKSGFKDFAIQKGGEILAT